MKYVVRGKTQEVEQVLEFWLEESISGDILLNAKVEHENFTWRILSITEKGELYLDSGIGKRLGLKLDDEAYLTPNCLKVHRK